MAGKPSYEELIDAVKGLREELAECRQIQEALRESEELHRTALDSISDAVIVTDDSGEMIFTSSNVDAVFGYSADEVRKLGNIVHLLGDSVIDRTELVKSGQIRNIEHQISDKHGNSRTLSINVKRIAEKGASTLFTCRDITERMQALKTQRESERKYRDLFDSNIDGIVFTTIDGRIREANQAFRDMLGYSMDELREMSYQQLTPEKWHQMEAQIVKTQFMTRGYCDEFEKEYIRKDGRVFPISLKGWTIFDKQGDPIGMWGYVRDITDRKKTEEELKAHHKNLAKMVAQRTAELTLKKSQLEAEIRERAKAQAEILQSKEEWETTFDAIPDLILLMDNQSRVINANKAACNKLGFKREQIIGQACYHVFHGTVSPPEYCPHERVIASGHAQFAEFYEPHLKTHYRFSATPLYNEHNQMVGVAEVAHDITDRKEVEDKLRKSERRYLKASQMAHFGYWERDFLNDTVYWSEETCRIFGVEPENFEPSFAFFMNLVHPDDREILDATLQDVRRNATPLDIVYRIVRPDEQDRIVHSLAEPISNKDGLVDVLSGTILDITEQKITENALKDSEKKARAISDTAMDAIFMMDHHGIISYLNPAAEQMFGYPKQEAEGKAFHEYFVSEASRQEYYQRLPEFARTGWCKVIGKKLELHATKKDGTRFPVELSVSSLKLKGQWHSAGIVRDISERKQIEEKLEKSRDLLNATGKMAKVGGWEFFVDTLDLSWTDEVYNIHEVDLNYEPTLEKAIAFYAPQSQAIIAQAVQKAIDLGEPFDLELQLITAKKNSLWVHAIGNIVPKDGRPFKVAGTFQDITTAKKAKERLRKLARSQSVLLREVNHRVTNNLSAIIGMLHMEERRASREQTSDLTVIRDIVSRIKGLIMVHKMLSQGGWRPLVLAQLCERIIQGVLKGLPLDQKFDLNVKSPDAIRITSDQAHHLTLVIGELATNSIKHGLRQTDRLRIGIALQRDGRRVSMHFQDNGPGYPEKILAGDKSREGIGLELIRGIVNHSLDGGVRLENNHGAKTIVTFLPEENGFAKDTG